MRDLNTKRKQRVQIVVNYDGYHECNKNSHCCQTYKSSKPRSESSIMILHGLIFTFFHQEIDRWVLHIDQRSSEEIVTLSCF